MPTEDSELWYSNLRAAMLRLTSDVFNLTEDSELWYSNLRAAMLRLTSDVFNLRQGKRRKTRSGKQKVGK